MANETELEALTELKAHAKSLHEDIVKAVTFLADHECDLNCGICEDTEHQIFCMECNYNQALDDMEALGVRS